MAEGPKGPNNVPGPVAAHSLHGDAKGISLSGLLSTSRTWERAIVPIGPAFRALAWSDLAALTLVGTLLLVLHDALTQPNAYFIVGRDLFVRIVDRSALLAAGHVGVALLLLGLSILTGGFAEAGPRVQIALAVVVGLGLVALLLPAGAFLIALANLALWVLYGMAMVAIGLLILWVLFMALSEM